MKMYKKNICCSTCFSAIAMKSTSAARLWLDLCDVEAHGVIHLGDQDDHSIWILENMQFITTTESERGIVIRIDNRVMQPDDDHNLICNEKFHE